MLPSALLCCHLKTVSQSKCPAPALFHPLWWVLLRCQHLLADGPCWAQGALRLWPHWSLLLSDQQSGEIACYFGSIFHALLNCFVLTHCQKWVVTLTQPEPGCGLQARALGLIPLQAEGRLVSSWVSSWQRCFAVLSNYDSDEPVKGKSLHIFCSIAISSPFVELKKWHARVLTPYLSYRAYWFDSQALFQGESKWLSTRSQGLKD